MMLLLPRAENAIVVCCCAEKSAGLAGCILCRVLSLTLEAKPEGDELLKTQSPIKMLIINALYKKQAKLTYAPKPHPTPRDALNAAKQRYECNATAPPTPVSCITFDRHVLAECKARIYSHKERPAGKTDQLGIIRDRGFWQRHRLFLRSVKPTSNNVLACFRMCAALAFTGVLEKSQSSCNFPSSLNAPSHESPAGAASMKS